MEMDCNLKKLATCFSFVSPKAMLRAISQLKKRNAIVVTKPDKGLGVVEIDKSDNVRLLKESSIETSTYLRSTQNSQAGATHASNTVCYGNIHDILACVE